MGKIDSSSIRSRKRPTKTLEYSLPTLERWKSIASIASAVAIPFVLAIVGYFIQKQLADEGLKKDYVSIAAGILKESPTGQEPDLRTWAVEVLDKNSPIPFSANAKRSLEQGIPLVVPGPALPPPIDSCMEPPKERTVHTALEQLVSNVEQSKDKGESIKVLLDHYMKFIDVVIEEEHNARTAASSLVCMQSWANVIVQADNGWRQTIGAPDSKSVYEKLRQEREAAETKKSKQPEPMPLKTTK